MKQIRLIPIGMVCTVVACLFASCASDDALQLSTKGEALTFSVGLNAVSPMEIDTRSVRFDTDTIFAGVMHKEEVEMSVGELSRAPLDDTPTWVGGEAVTVQVDGRFFQYTIGGSGSSSTMTSAAPYYFTNLNSLTANAWYPSTEGAVVSTTHSVSASQNNDANFKNSDFLYGSASVVHSNTANSISLSHKIAKVRVTVNVANPSYLANATINSVVLSGTKRDGTVGSKGVLTAKNSASDITMHKRGDNVFEACIIPQNASLTFKVNVGGTIYTANAITSRDYAANNVYTATINISASKFLYQGNTSVDIGDFYGIYANGQGVVIDGNSSAVTAAKNKGITPVALIYSTSTSNTDKSHGWTNGYAISLHKVGGGNYAWSTESGSTVMNQQFPWKPTIEEMTPCWEFYDGYTDTHTITDNRNNNATNYPAFFAAINYQNNYSLSSATSKWYLPSHGQMYRFLREIGGMSSNVAPYDVVIWYVNPNNGTMVDIIDRNINGYFSVAGEGSYTPFPINPDEAYYVTSTEVNASSYILVRFPYYGHLDFYSTNNLKNDSHEVRPFMAF
ncbi:MAG: fimbrillin family protein [Prevotella sp.]|nr:fimbrillin family protein [Prevotella sp.]